MLVTKACFLLQLIFYLGHVLRYMNRCCSLVFFSTNLMRSRRFFRRLLNRIVCLVRCCTTMTSLAECYDKRVHDIVAATTQFCQRQNLVASLPSVQICPSTKYTLILRHRMQRSCRVLLAISAIADSASACRSTGTIDLQNRPVGGRKCMFVQRPV